MKTRARHISGIICLLLGAGAVVLVLLGVFYNIVVRTFDMELVASTVLYSLLGLVLLLVGKHLVKA